MAFRIHVTALRDCNKEAVRNAFTEILGEDFANVELVDHGGWISFRTSVWQVSSRDLIRGLRELNRFGLQLTTEDGSRWYATMCRPDMEPESIIHEFGSHGEVEFDEEDFDVDEDYDENYVDHELAFLEDDPDKKPQPKTPFQGFAEQYRDLGLGLPADLLQQSESLSFREAILRFQRWHDDRLLDFLTEAGVSFDRDAIIKTLNWRGLTEAERDSDLGNLPRLLKEIGLGGEFETFIDEAEQSSLSDAGDNDSDDQGNDDEFEQSDGKFDGPDSTQTLADAKQVIGQIEATEIVDGPVPLPLRNFDRVAYFAEACQIENEIRSLLTVKLPHAFELQDFEELVSDSKPDRAACEWVPGGFNIGFENHLLVNWGHFRKQLGLDLAKFLENLPDDSTFSLAFAAEDEPATHQVYRGKIRDQIWRIDATHPPLSAQVLTESLDLAADAPKTEHGLRNEAEAITVMEAVQKDSYLHSMDVQRAGNVVSCQYDVEFLAKIIFRLRYADYWDVRPHENHAEQQYRERIKMEWELRRSLAKQAKIANPPRMGDPIFRGQASIYWRSDLGHFDNLDAEVGDKFLNAMEELQFEPLGDLNAKRFRQHALRCCVSPDRLSYAILTASMHGYLCWEFISDFSDASRLATTTSPMAFSRPAVKLYYKDYPGLEVADLYAKHIQLFERFKTYKQADPISLEPSLEAVAKMFDDSLVRADEDEANYEDEDDEDDEDWNDAVDEFDDENEED